MGEGNAWWMCEWWSTMGGEHGVAEDDMRCDAMQRYRDDEGERGREGQQAGSREKGNRIKLIHG